jgi:hypothetical protein
LIQVLILAGLAVFLRSYLPHRAREAVKRNATEREEEISALFRESVDDSPQEASVPLDGAIVKRHPQKLRDDFSPQHAESMLGVPDFTGTDFRGGQHLTWLGTAHKLVASFDAGHLYCLSLEDRATGHGAFVYRSFEMWRPY